VSAPQRKTLRETLAVTPVTPVTPVTLVTLVTPLTPKKALIPGSVDAEPDPTNQIHILIGAPRALKKAPTVIPAKALTAADTEVIRVDLIETLRPTSADIRAPKVQRAVDMEAESKLSTS